MKQALLIILFAFSVQGVKAQDLIIQTSGDTISCIITKETEEMLYYNQKVFDEYLSSFISKRFVKEVIRANPEDETIQEAPKAIRFKLGPYINWSFDVGISAGVADFIFYYDRRLGEVAQTGIQVEFFKGISQSGLGFYTLHALDFGSKNFSNQAIIDNRNSTITRTDVAVTSRFYSGVIGVGYHRVSKKQKFLWVFNSGIGIAALNQEINFFHQERQTGTSFIWHQALGASFPLNKRYLMYFGISSSIAGIGHIKSTLDGVEQQSISTNTSYEDRSYLGLVARLSIVK